ncbi:hypothetical protein K402DRAFT_392994 [Aulographum hederae CBS 113979]|uniref:Uncharacterized protein n=1 Tax=Aulographum hederae CBS 113979 TaxID=1176131 RepID=A0A6G1H2K2_9PEZI|nr:hypothetical protein K402DRAFT_392994 [Aulographum hederae CBS 113979]
MLEKDNQMNESSESLSAPPPAYSTLPESDLALTTSDAKRVATEATSSTSSLSLEDTQTNGFAHTRVLDISSKGHGMWHFPTPPTELETPITDEEGRIQYVSTKLTRRKGNATLSSPKRGVLAETKYRFGPGKDPEVRLLNIAGVGAAESSDVQGGSSNEELGGIKLKGKLGTRARTFDMPDGKSFRWSYVRTRYCEKNSKGKEKENRYWLLVLEYVEKIYVGVGKKKEEMSSRRIAQLVRNKETMTQGTRKSTAGNGGRLMMTELVGEGEKAVIDEALVIATCLVMMKREVDRLRMQQIAAIAGGASGGG